MIHFILYSIIISLFSTIIGMDQSYKKSPIYIQTKDNQTVLLDKAIIQQSNLLTVLQDIYKGTAQQPLMAPITKTELDLFSTAIRQSAHVFTAKLNDKEYSFLMDIAEQLKAPLFYADLMEQILPVKELIKYFAPICLNKALLKKAIYKKHLKKKCAILYEDNMQIKVIQLKFSNEGSYFAETIAASNNFHITNLRHTQNFSRCSQLKGKYITSSPDGTFVIMSNDGGGYILYNSHSTKNLNKPNYTISFPKIHPKSNAIIIENELHTIDNEQNITTTLISENDRIEATFHPSLSLIISASYNRNSDETQITVHDLEKSTKQLVGAYKTNFYYNPTNIIINSDGSLLLISKNILLNIQDPYNPIILKQQLTEDPCSYDQVGFITQKPIIFFQEGKDKFLLFDKYGKEILSGDGSAQQMITDPTDNFIAILANRIIKIFKTSHLEQNTQPLIIKEPTHIESIAFINEQLFLTQSYTTKVWDMEGDEVLNLGRIEHYTINSSTNSLIASCSLTLDKHNSFTSTRPIEGPTKLYHYTINTPKVLQVIKNITESLTLSQALLLNTYCAKKIKKQKKLYPNLPDGRAFASLPEKHTFLAQNLKLSKTEYVPIQTTQ